MEDYSFEEEMRKSRDSIKKMREFTDDEWFLSHLRGVSNSLENIQELYEEALRYNGAALKDRDRFELCYAQLAGLNEQFTAFGRKRPESACGSFKAQQVNRVLEPLKALMEEDMGIALSLISEENEQTYSDVSLLLRTYLDLGSSFAWRHYKKKYDSRGRELPAVGQGYGHG